MRRAEESEAEAEAEGGSAVTDLVAEGVGLLASIKELMTEVRDDIRRERVSRRNTDNRLWQELEELRERLSALEITRLASSQAFEMYMAEAADVEDSAEETDREDGKEKEQEGEAEGGDSESVV